MAHFDEKAGVVPVATPWGRWWQTIEEVQIEIRLPKNTRARDITCIFSPNRLTCRLAGPAPTDFINVSLNEFVSAFILLLVGFPCVGSAPA